VLSVIASHRNEFVEDATPLDPPPQCSASTTLQGTSKNQHRLAMSAGLAGVQTGIIREQFVIKWHAASSSGCAIRPRVQEIGLIAAGIGFAVSLTALPSGLTLPRSIAAALMLLLALGAAEWWLEWKS
jgi:hypothetical protein